MKVLWVGMLGVVLPVVPVQAQRVCGTAGTTTEIRQCAADELAKAERQLAEVLEAYRQLLSDARRDLLGRAQEAWQDQRSALCELVSSRFEGGSLRPVVELQCMAEVTDQRWRELLRWLHEERGREPPQIPQDQRANGA